MTLSQTGTITTVAGIGLENGYGGDGGPATSAHLSSPYGVAVDTSGNLYIADTYNHVIRKVFTINKTSSDILVNFGSGTGFWAKYNNTNWTKLHNMSAEIIETGDLDSNGQDDVIVDFGSGIGIYVRYNNSTWTKLHSLSPESITTGNSDNN